MLLMQLAGHLHARCALGYKSGNQHATLSSALQSSMQWIQSTPEVCCHAYLTCLSLPPQQQAACRAAPMSTGHSQLSASVLHTLRDQCLSQASSSSLEAVLACLSSPLPCCQGARTRKATTLCGTSTTWQVGMRLPFALTLRTVKRAQSMALESRGRAGRRAWCSIMSMVMRPSAGWQASCASRQRQAPAIGTT